MKNRNTRAMVLAIFALLCAACSIALPACKGPGQAYRDMIEASDAAANQTIGPKFLRYVEADAALSEESKQTWRDLVASWRSAIASAKQEIEAQ